MPEGGFQAMLEVQEHLVLLKGVPGGGLDGAQGKVRGEGEGAEGAGGEAEERLGNKVGADK